MGPSVDGREAYVERVVLNVYGGPGVTNVWIDDLEVAGSPLRRAVPPGDIAAAARMPPVSNEAIIPATPPGPARRAARTRSRGRACN